MSTENQVAAPAAPSFLTPAELEVLALNYDDNLSEDPDHVPDQDAAPADDDGPDAPAAVSADADATTDPAPAPDAAADAAPVDAKATTPAADPAPADVQVVEPVAAPAPILVLEAPADAKEQIAALKAAKKELAAKFDNGDLTGTEFNDKRDELDEQQRAIETQVNNAALSQQMEQQRQQNEWNRACDAFFASEGAKAYNTDTALFDQFNDTVKAVAGLPRNRTLTGPQLLAKVHTMLQAELGDAFPKAAAPAPAAKEVDKPLPKPRAELPPVIGSLPAADVTAATGGKYDAIDKLASSDPLAYQARLAAMPEHEREAYLKA